MTYSDAIQTSVFNIPQRIPTGVSFSDYLAIQLEQYEQLIDSIEDKGLKEQIELNREKISLHCKNLLESIRSYLNGHPSISFDFLKKAVSNIEEFLFPNSSGGKVKIIDLVDPYFRGRIGTNIQYSKAEMFHRSVMEREYISSERFSIPGLPCLYLSNSIYTVWEELNRPPISSLQISRFQCVKDQNLLDISLTPQQILSFIKEGTSSKLLFIFLMRWPLILSCSAMVSKPDAPFKPEYIFPQLLMQFVILNKNLDGIKYFSVKANPYNTNDYSNFINYAIPVKTEFVNGYCKRLMESFKMTPPISWELLTLSDPFLNKVYMNSEASTTHGYTVNPDTGAILLELIKGYKIPYSHTVFGILERVLSNPNNFKAESLI